jgi:hypothetical protein
MAETAALLSEEALSTRGRRQRRALRQTEAQCKLVIGSALLGHIALTIN